MRVSANLPAFVTALRRRRILCDDRDQKTGFALLPRLGVKPGVTRNAFASSPTSVHGPAVRTCRTIARGRNFRPNRTVFNAAYRAEKRLHSKISRRRRSSIKWRGFALSEGCFAQSRSV
jgi:hypothetical protein